MIDSPLNAKVDPLGVEADIGGATVCMSVVLAEADVKDTAFSKAMAAFIYVSSPMSCAAHPLLGKHWPRAASGQSSASSQECTIGAGRSRP